MRVSISLRGASLGLGVASVLLPVGYAVWQHLAFRQWVATQPSGVVCGLPWLGAMLLAAVGAAVLSFAAVVCGGLGLARLPAPRPASRWVELAVLALPLALVAAGPVLIVVLKR